MLYASARDHIRTGDLIAVRSKRGVLPTLTRLVTVSPYTHTAVAVWSSDRLLVAETNGAGASLSPLSHYQGGDFDVFGCPVDRHLAALTLWEMLGVKIDYGYVDLLRIAANRLFKVPLPPHDDGGLICSALSATIYLHAGWRPEHLPSIPAPDDVVAAMKAPPRLEVRA